MVKDLRLTGLILEPHTKGYTNLLYRETTHLGRGITLARNQSLLAARTLTMRALPTKEREWRFQELSLDSSFSNLVCQLFLSTLMVPFEYQTPQIFILFIQVRPKGERGWRTTNVARVQIRVSTPYVGWVCCWFSPLLREVFLWVLRFSPVLKHQHFQIPIRPGIR